MTVNRFRGQRPCLLFPRAVGFRGCLAFPGLAGCNVWVQQTQAMQTAEPSGFSDSSACLQIFELQRTVMPVWRCRVQRLFNLVTPASRQFSDTTACYVRERERESLCCLTSTEASRPIGDGLLRGQRDYFYTARYK